MPIINGRQMNIPSSGIYGSELIREAGPASGRRTVIHDKLGFKQVDPSQRYSKSQLIDKKGKPVKISTIPDRSKGSRLLLIN